MPMPRKERNASSKMTFGMAIVMLVIIRPLILGIMCLIIMRLSDAPSTREAMTYSMFLS